MADSGVAVVAPMPSEQQRHEPLEQADKVEPIVTESRDLSQHITTKPVLPPPQSPQPSCPPSKQSVTADSEPSTNRPDGPTPPDVNKLCKMEVVDMEKSHENEDELDSSGTTLQGDETIQSGCSSGKDEKIQIKKSDGDEPKATTTADQTVKKNRKIDEIIIDGFAISAFKSWEELQDDMNERIAANLLKKRAAEKEAANNEVPVKRKKTSKSKSSQSSTSGNSSSQQPKADKVKKIKKDASKSCKKSSNGHSSKSGDSKSSIKKPKTGDRSKENANEGTSSESQERDQARRTSEGPHKASTDSDRHDIPRPVDNNRNDGSQTPQSPQVHQVRNHHEQTLDVTQPQSRMPQPPGPPKILAQDLLRDPHATNNSQTAQYLPYSTNPHLNHLYNVTSNIHQPMQAPPFNHHHPGFKSNPQPDHPRAPQQNSQSQSSKQSAPASVPAQQSQSPLSTQHQAYKNAQAPTMSTNAGSPHLHNPPMAPGMSQSHPLYPHPMHMPGPIPYPYHQQHTNPSQHHHPSGPPHINPQMQSNPHSPYAQAAAPHHPHQYQYPGYPPTQGAHQPPHLPPFNMYSPHMLHQQPQGNSMMASMSMSQLPYPYGSPYIVNETTISRQTSIIPPSMPSALEQATALATANWFGQHPRLPQRGAYNPAVAAAAAAAVAQSQGHPHPQNNPSSMYQSSPIAPSSVLSNAERSFIDLARNHGAASTASPVAGGQQLAHYANMMNSQSAAYPPTSAPGSYGLDRWPTKMTFEHHQRAVNRFNSLYQSAASNTGFPPRPPTFPASLFPPPF